MDNVKLIKEKFQRTETKMNEGFGKLSYTDRMRRHGEPRQKNESERSRISTFKIV